MNTHGICHKSSEVLQKNIQAAATVIEIPIFSCMLLLPERQMGEAWEPFLKQCSFGYGKEELDRKMLPLYISI
jgi:hypothetical protein